jgi:hypothetical protein
LFKSGIEKFLKQTFFTSAAGNNMIVIWSVVLFLRMAQYE